MNSWSDFTALAKAAKSTLSAAQKKIDAVLDIQEQKEQKTDDAESSITEEVEDTEADPVQGSTPSASFNKLQEDFFAAFGIASATGADPNSSRQSSKSKATDESKPAWKSLFNTFSGSSPSSKVQEDKSLVEMDETDETGQKGFSTDHSNQSIPTEPQSQQLFVAEEGSFGSSSFDHVGDSPDPGRGSRFSAVSIEELKSDESGGWCTESLVVPETLTTITNFDNVDLMSPADPSPFFNTDAHLTFVGEDDQEGTDTSDMATMIPSTMEPDTSVPEHHSSLEPDLVFFTSQGNVSSLETTGLSMYESAIFATLASADTTMDSSDATASSDWSSYSIAKASTSSCATNDTEYSIDSMATVVQAPGFSSIPLTNSSIAPDMASSPTSRLSSASNFERNLSSNFMDSTITSSSDSYEKSVATIVDGGGEEETQKAFEEEEREDGQDVTTVDFECSPPRQEETASASFSIETMLTKVSSELEILRHDQLNDLVDDDGGLVMKTSGHEEVISIEQPPSADEILPDLQTDDDHGELVANISESFVQLSRSGSNNGGGESNEGSGHSPTQPTACGKSSGEASADELLDDVEAATTCSDVEIISTPPYDTVSERSSRSGIVSRSAVDWSFHPPSKLFQAAKDNGSRKKAHRRVGSDQSLASCDSFPTGVGGPSAISRSASFSVQDYEKKMAHLTEMLEARERKLLDIAKENAQLADENEQLRNELQQLHSRISRDANMDSVQRELSERLNNIERKCDSLTKERDALKRKCDNLEKEVASRVTAQQLKEKDEQIAELMAEGEKLSKQELKQGNVIKKLREKEKDQEKQLDTMKQKLKDMDDLRQKLKEKDEQEIKYDEMVHELKSTVTKQEKAMAKLRSDLEDAKDKCTSYKATLENCARDIAELNQEKAVKDAEIQRLAARAAESKEGELQARLGEAELHWQTEKQSLIREIQCLRMSSTQDGDEFQRREQSLRWEIAQLHKKLQETEERNQELAESISTATKPVLRQLDSMQLSFRTQQANWERVEKSLYERINEAERTASAAVEKEREAQLTSTEMKSRCGHLETQHSSLLKEKNKLEVALASAQRDVENMENLRKKYVEDLQSEKSLHQQALEALGKDKELIAGQFEYEKRQTKSQYEKVIADLTEKLNEKENLMVSLRQQLTNSQDALQRSSIPSTASFSQPLLLRITSESPPLVQDRPSRTPSSASFAQDDQHQTYDMWPNDAAGGGYATLLERLRSRLQQREGELGVVRDEMRSLQQSRDSLALQLITLSNSNCEMELQVQELEHLRQQYKELDEKYQGLLLLYGEQIERNEELQLDLQDVKAVYKEQLDALLQRPAT